jgi:4-hydroxy-tetrahydrodipicolinate reductase
MKIALIGYGKMGKAIEQIAITQGHEIILKISSTNQQDFTIENLKKADVAIEFSTPEIAWHNLKILLQAGIPTVCGTTAWLDHLDHAKKLTLASETAFIFASNFSIGVNLFFAVNEYLAQLMKTQNQYEIQIEEIHHTQKKDAPSGTAVTIAEGILNKIGRKEKWVNHLSNEPKDLSIISQRIDPAPGTHKINYSSAIDDIEIIHTAHNRIGFASGAIAAAEYIWNKKGIFTMKDVLGLTDPS